MSIYLNIYNRILLSFLDIHRFQLEFYMLKYTGVYNMYVLCIIHRISILLQVFDLYIRVVHIHIYTYSIRSRKKNHPSTYKLHVYYHCLMLLLYKTNTRQGIFDYPCDIPIQKSKIGFIINFLLYVVVVFPMNVCIIDSNFKLYDFSIQSNITSLTIFITFVYKYIYSTKHEDLQEIKWLL